jgi:hypothetical protein
MIYDVFSDTEISFEETFYLTSAADHWPIGTSFSSFALLGQDYKENVTFSWAQSNPYIDLNESYSKTSTLFHSNMNSSPQLKFWFHYSKYWSTIKEM